MCYYRLEKINQLGLLNQYNNPQSFTNDQNPDFPKNSRILCFEFYRYNRRYAGKDTRTYATKYLKIFLSIVAFAYCVNPKYKNGMAQAYYKVLTTTKINFQEPI